MIMSLFKDKRGESLVETLVAILIFTLSSIALYSTVTSAARVNAETREMDEAIQEQMVIVENASADPAPGNITLKTDAEHSIPVNIYIGEPGEDSKFTLYSYYKKPAGGTEP